MVGKILLFNNRAGLYVGLYSFGHNSQAAAATEVFKPSTDLASHLVPSQKNFFFRFEDTPGRRHK